MTTGIDLSEGDPCPESACAGRMGYHKVADCYCHINPPCSRCVDNPLVCLECGFEAEGECP